MSFPLKDSWHGNTGGSIKSRQDPLHQLIFLITWNSSIQVWFLLYHLINNQAKGIALVNIMLNIAREESLLGSGVSKCEEATGLISPGQTHWSANRQRDTACLHLSTWFNSWLWLKFHDCVLVVAKGTLIDWSEIYSAVADCEDRGRGVGLGLL